MQMGSMSLMHWLVAIGILYALVVVPVARIMRRAGRSSYWSILALIPLVSLIGLWVFAFTRWPALDESGENAKTILLQSN